jgi:hypothetical protein
MAQGATDNDPVMRVGIGSDWLRQTGQPLGCRGNEEGQIVVGEKSECVAIPDKLDGGCAKHTLELHERPRRPGL